MAASGQRGRKARLTGKGHELASMSALGTKRTCRRSRPMSVVEGGADSLSREPMSGNDLQAGGLVVGTDAFFRGRLEQLAALSVRYAVPTVYQFREFAAVGGLIGYGGSLAEAFRGTGVYSGRILKGDKPGDLPGPASNETGALHQPEDRQGARGGGRSWRRKSRLCSSKP
jgi:hypothetical protein